MDAVGSRLADDPEAFRDAYARLSPMVGDYLRRFVPRGEIEDVRQQVFLEVWRSRSRYDTERGLEPWVMTIAKRRAIDHLRRQSRTPVDPVATLPTQPAEPRAEFADAVADGDAMRAALASLPNEQRTALQMAYYEQMTQPEIAAALEVPLGTVKARCHRGLRKLAQLLVPDDDDEESPSEPFAKEEGL
jgi:RNA polymerase sigma-70 factor (ECF subfamily)